MATMKEVLTAARVRWSGAQIRKNDKALSASARDANLQAWKALQARWQELDVALKVAGDTRKPLLAAARFALDVDGDEPSWFQLRAAVEAAEQVDAMREEWRETKKEMDRLAGMRYGRRFEVYTIENMGPLGRCLVQHTAADSLDELLLKLSS